MQVTKPRTPLFNDVTQDVYQRAHERLQEMRAKHPEYGDNVLLLHELCVEISKSYEYANRSLSD